MRTGVSNIAGPLALPSINFHPVHKDILVGQVGGHDWFADSVLGTYVNDN